MRCAMTDVEYPDYADGIWDDGEWIGWDWLNGQIHERDMLEVFPNADPALIHVFEQFLEVAIAYKEATGHYLQVWGALGEIYAAIKFGITLNRPRAQGSDGKLGNDFVEVKTISPEKSDEKVQAKRSGNFSKLVVVKIDENFRFAAQMFDRQKMSKGGGKFVRVKWPGSEQPSS
jgi:hypothetical protein